MKKILSLLIALMLFAVSCSDKNSSITDSNTLESNTSEEEMIQLPEKSGLSTELTISTSKTINGAYGGTLSLFGTYISLKGKLVVISANLQIPQNAFSGIKTITMKADDKFAALYFSPGMVFSKSLTLNSTFTGLDLSNLGLFGSTVDFYFFDDCGHKYPVAKESKTINLLTGTLTVKNAKIDHFSRYGWGR